MTTLTIDPAHLGNRALTLTIGSMPEAAAEPVRIALTECLAFVPRWVREFEVYWAERDRSEWASTKLQSRYRRAEMFLNEGWLTLSPRKRRQTVLHELAHVWLMPFHGATHDAFDTMLQAQPETVSKTCYEVFESGMETTAEDLALLFDEMIESGALAPVSIDLRTGARTSPKRKRGGRR